MSCMSILKRSFHDDFVEEEVIKHKKHHYHSIEISLNRKIQGDELILSCKQQEGGFVSTHVLNLKCYFDRIEQLAIDVILNFLTVAYKHFTMNYYIIGLEKIIMELHGMLKTVEESIVPHQNTSSTTHVPTIRDDSVKRKRPCHPNFKVKWKWKLGAPNSNHTNDVFDIPPGHWKCRCPKYLEDLKKKKAKGVGTSSMLTIKLHSASTSNNWILDIGCGTHICSDVQGLR
uniref:Uncharacterized protein n=1 Tax=Lactuca sativa TaxID=4236 RepID=A0A9R1WVU2_LACSA|nr:hypothetical protein LSAT_V11C800413990 [Lactuca sativa]